MTALVCATPLLTVTQLSALAQYWCKMTHRPQLVTVTLVRSFTSLPSVGSYWGTGLTLFYQLLNRGCFMPGASYVSAFLWKTSSAPYSVSQLSQTNTTLTKLGLCYVIAASKNTCFTSVVALQCQPCVVEVACLCSVPTDLPPRWYTLRSLSKADSVLCAPEHWRSRCSALIQGVWQKCCINHSGITATFMHILLFLGDK